MIKNDEYCYGCSACRAICSQQAINMVENKQGFLEPVINQDKCVNCGMCLKVCPKESKRINQNEPLQTVALQNRNEKHRMQSTSGGAFWILSQFIIGRKGVVYGVAHNEEFSVSHIRALTQEECNRMQGSKYVQSSIGDSFSDIYNDLCNDKYVLFSGTPCQVDGLLNYLETKRVSTEKLFTCQIICHGVPSPMIWKDHIRFIQKKRNKRIASYIHRPKDYGWHEHNEKVIYVDGSSESQSKLTQNFKDLFYLGYSMRESCFSCTYAGKAGRADFNIGDFWGIEYIIPQMDDNKGTSVVMVNTKKGMRLLKDCSDNCRLYKVNFEDAFRYNHKGPSKKPSDYQAFWDNYLNNGYEYVVRRYGGYKYPNIIIYRIKKVLRRFLVKHSIIGY